MNYSGITKVAVRHLADFLSLPWKPVVSLLPVTERTLQRYDQRKHLNVVVSEQVLQIAALVVRGIEVFGDKEKFLEWMKSPCTALANQKPVELFKSRLGLKMVIDEIGRIEHGEAVQDSRDEPYQRLVRHRFQDCMEKKKA